jgi:acyl-CoA synthetase (NDP forming)
VRAAELYLSGRRPRGKRLVFVSNSGASCVMAADHAEQHRIPLAAISDGAKARLKEALPAFAALENPVDVTGALLGNSKLLSAVLPIIGDDAQSDTVVLALPVAGTGYDVPRFAADLASFSERYGHAAAVAAPQATVRAEFAKAGIATFAREGEAMDALTQVADHCALLSKPAPPAISSEIGEARFLERGGEPRHAGQGGLAGGRASAVPRRGELCRRP